MTQRAALASRRKKAVETFGNAQAAIGELYPGMSIFGITRGQFSMIDIILYLLREMGRASITVWTWAIADYETEVFSGLMQRKEIESALLVVDYSASRRNGELLAGWRALYGPGSVKVCMNHAKVARVWNEDYRFLARGSMNLNFNPRFEQFDLTEGGNDFDLVERIEAELDLLPVEHSKREAQAVTKLGMAFDLSKLEIFEANKIWRP
jgi:hypothetical protein